MSTYWLAGWRKYWVEQRAHRDARAAYDRLAESHRRLLGRLRVEEQRCADMFFAATGACEECAVLRDERDSALFDVATMRSERDEWHRAAQFLERIGFAGSGEGLS